MTDRIVDARRIYNDTTWQFTFASDTRVTLEDAGLATALVLLAQAERRVLAWQHIVKVRSGEEVKRNE